MSLVLAAISAPQPICTIADWESGGRSKACAGLPDSQRHRSATLHLTCNLLVAYDTRMVFDEDKVFKALADASRRKLLDRLRKKNGLTLSELSVQHDMSRQAVSKHLALLEAANLVVTIKRGREKLHFLNPVPINDIYMRWVGRFEQERVAALHNLKQALEENDHEQH